MDACVVRKVPERVRPGARQADSRSTSRSRRPCRCAPTIDPETCLTLKGKKCKQPCTTACGPQAIDFEQQDEVLDLEVGAIIMATGFELWEPDQDSALRLRAARQRHHQPRVRAHLQRVRPHRRRTSSCKNGEAPKSVAILHCVGSRDVNHQEYCSRVCCMYSLKFSHLIKEHLPETEVYELYIDMRCYGKGYEEFYRRLMDEGVHFVRGRAAEVTNVALSPEEEGRLVVKTEDTLLGIVRRIPADMVILSSGLAPAKDAKEVSQTFGFGCSANGFFLERHPKLEPVSTVTDGIFIAGCCQYPKDIPDTVAQAGAAAACALALVDNPTVKVEPTISYIDPEKCAGCHICVSALPAHRDPVQRGEGRRRGHHRRLQGLRRLRRRLRQQRAAAGRLPRRPDLRRDRRGHGPLRPCVSEGEHSE